MLAITVSEAQIRVGRVLTALKGPFLLRFFPYPDVRARLCLVCIERPDGVDVLQVLAEFDRPIPDIYDEHAIALEFCEVPDGAAVTLMGDVPMANETPGRIVKFLDDGDDVIALDDRGGRYRTEKGSFNWRSDPPQPVPQPQERRKGRLWRS